MTILSFPNYNFTPIKSSHVMALTCKLSQEAQQTGWLSFYVLIIFWSLDLPSNESNYWVFHTMFLDVTAYIWELKKNTK